VTINIQYRQADGATLLSGATDDFGLVVSPPATAVNTTPKKLCLENISDRALGISPFTALVLRRVQVGTNDGIAFFFSALDGNGTISKPWGLDTQGGVPTGAPTAVDDSAGGTWGATGSYGVRIVATNATGKTIGSVEKVFAVTDTTRRWLYSWIQTPGATGYEVHRTSTPGTYGASTLRATIGSGATVTFLDDGTAASAGTPPSANTTGGASPTYGTPPSVASHTAADKTIATAGAGGLAVGQQWFFYADAKVPAGSSSVGNKRAMQLLPVEV